MICLVKPGLRPAHAALRLRRPAERPAAGAADGLSAARPGQQQRRPGGGRTIRGSGRSRARSFISRPARAAIFCVLRDEVDGQPQGAVVPLPGEFRSGVHRGKVNPARRPALCLAAWPAGEPTRPTTAASTACATRATAVQLPQVAARSRKRRADLVHRAGRPRRQSPNLTNHFAQVWNYRYSPGYGSPELAPSHPGVVGHEPLAIAGVHRDRRADACSSSCPTCSR